MLLQDGIVTYSTVPLCVFAHFILFFTTSFLPGVFDESRYWDVFCEYVKHDANDILVKITVANRGPETSTIHVLPTLWYRNTWIWGCRHEGCTMKPKIVKSGEATVTCTHETLEKFHCEWGVNQEGKKPELWFTENETNSKVWLQSMVFPYRIFPPISSSTCGLLRK